MAWHLAKHVLALVVGLFLGAAIYLAIVLFGYYGMAEGFLLVPLIPLSIPVLFFREIYLNENVRENPLPSFHLTTACLGMSLPIIMLFIDIVD